ncbi:Exodeoxyribonuclease I [Pantoea agglomerans]|uniref:Exodeoxyribonuclease I n=1 Tax=Enterobacter agglomerans TaxID=549 RepID=A0A379ADZ3_ENTAG|nr:Exodeoxyribonuclease I [Pantoea agglomerans]
MSPLLQLDADTLRERLYTPKNDLGDLPAVPVKLVHINKCPVLAPASTLRPEDAARLNIDRQHCLANLALLRQQPDVRGKNWSRCLPKRSLLRRQDDVDTQLYDGFFSDADRAGMNIIRQTAPANLPALDLSFESARVAKLLFRYRARNFPGTLDDAEQQRWLQHRREVLNAERVQAFMQELEALANLHEGGCRKGWAA